MNEIEMRRCQNTDAIKSDRHSCAYVKASTGFWDFECTHPCVLAARQEIATLDKKLREYEEGLRMAHENNRMLVKAFEGFLPLCKKVVEASEAIKKDAKE